MEEKELFKSKENFMILQICGMLQENNIPYIKSRDLYRRIGCRSESSETKIFVSSEDYEKAKILIEVFDENAIVYNNDELPEELKEAVNEEEMEKDIQKYKNMKITVYFWIPTIMSVIAIIVSIIANQINGLGK